MVNRVVLGALPGGGVGLRVSRPGFDVLNTALTGKQIAFDSRWAASGRVVTMGAVSVPNTDSATTVNFGVTLPSVPVVIGMFRTTFDASRWVPMEVLDAEGMKNVREPMSGPVYNVAQINAWLDPANDSPSLEVFTNRFVFRHGYYSSNGLDTGDFLRYGDRLAYIVMRSS